MNKNMIFRGAKSLALLTGLILSVSVNAASINAMKVISKDFTRVIFSADAALTHEVLLLDNPKRLVLDIKNAPTNETIKMLANQDWSKHLYIKKTRIGTLPDNASRVVFDLTSNVYHKISADINEENKSKGTQHQLVLDIFKGVN